LREKEEISYSLIRRTIQRVAPFFDEFRLQPLRLKPDDIKLEWKHKNSDQYFDASSLSDGTLRFIALTTLFLQGRDHLPSVVLVDETRVGSASLRHHNARIPDPPGVEGHPSDRLDSIISPFGSLRPEDVLVANRVGSATEIARLEPAQLSNWRDDL